VCLCCSVAFGQAGQVGALVADTTNGCKIWNPHPQPDETVKWSGDCIGGLAQGPGTLQWFRNGKPSETDQGQWTQGRQSGHGVQDWSTGRYEGALLDGEPHGRGVMTLQGARYEGEFRNGKPNGEGAVTNLEGVFRGKWKDGCLVSEKRRVAFAVSSATCR
jgi:hypothetical protein